jgi:hypothetical protein
LKNSGSFIDNEDRADILKEAKPDFVTISLSSLLSLLKLDLNKLSDRLHCGFVYDRFESKFLQKNSTKTLMDERQDFTCIPIDFKELESYKAEFEILNIRVLI